MTDNLGALRSRDLSIKGSLALLLAGAALTAAVAAGLITASLPLGAPEWSWRLRSLPLAWGVPATVALLAALLMAVLVGDRLRSDREPSRRVCALLLVVMIVLGTVLCLGVAFHDAVYPVSGALVVLSDLATGYYTAAARLSGPVEAFSGHLQRAPSEEVPDRLRTHPPGPILFMMTLRNLVLAQPRALAVLEEYLARAYGGLSGEGLVRLSRAGTAAPLSAADALIAVPVSLLLTVLPVLIVLPVYGLGATLADRKVGLAAASLSLTLPSLLCFVPGIDGLGAVLVLTALYLWVASLRCGYWWLYALTGLAASVALLWSFGYLAIAPVAIFLCWRRGTWQPQRLGQGLVFAWAVVTIFYGVCEAAFGYSLPAAAAASLGAQRQIMLREQRGYLPWALLNPYAWAVFLGPGLLLTFLACWARREVRESVLGSVGRGLWITLALLVLVGTTRGEVERIWVFLMPLAALVAGVLFPRFPGSLRLWGPALLIFVQVAYALVLRTFLDLVSAV